MKGSNKTTKQRTKLKTGAEPRTDSEKKIQKRYEDSVFSKKVVIGEHERHLNEVRSGMEKRIKNDRDYQEQITKAHGDLFDDWNSKRYMPDDYKIKVAADSLESNVGYSSLIRQLHDAYAGTIAFYRSYEGGSYSREEAREQAFHIAANPVEAKELFKKIMAYPFHDIFFDHLHQLQGYAPRVAEHLWEEIKREGRADFESGHMASNAMFPVSYMRQAWDVARYLGVRESFIEEWQPKGGIEISLIDMLAQSFFQWQFWIGQTVKRSQTEPREEHPDYQSWKVSKREKSWDEGYWFPPYVSEQQAIEHAVKMADRFNRIFMRTLRQLRDLRRYSVTINNASQINIASENGKQVNVVNKNK